MSSFFAILNRNDKPISPDIVQELLEGISYWEPDDKGILIDNSIAFGHTMLWNTPESKFDHLPRERGHLVIVMDARLDNRVELSEQLTIPNHLVNQTTDSDFILKAYQQWKEDCPKHLIGDFSFVIMDKAKQQIFCARDHVGAKQLYFHLSETLFVCGNDIKALLKHPAISEQLCDAAIANFIANAELRSSTLTFFKDLQKLSPAHTLAINSSSVRQHCYWKLEDAPRVMLENDKAYAKRLRELLERAVHDRLRSAYPITSHLSGGLDSSSIAVIAARYLNDKGEKLHAFNWIHAPSAGEDSSIPEWNNSKRIAEAENIVHEYVPLSEESLSSFLDTQTIIYGKYTLSLYEHYIRNRVREIESRTILSGWGGDELATYHGQAYINDLISQGRIFKALKIILKRARQKKSGIRNMAAMVSYPIMLNLIPTWLYRFVFKKEDDSDTSFPFVTKEFLPTVIKEKKKSTHLTRQSKKTIRSHMLAFWENGHLQTRIESWATGAILKRLEYAYPLLDKRIIEFIIGVPPDHFVHDGGRYLYRSASEGVLPADILWNDTKYEPRRVERLLALLIPYYQKRITLDRKSLGRYSHYIMIDQVVEALQDLHLVPKEDLYKVGIALQGSIYLSTGLGRKALEPQGFYVDKGRLPSEVG